MKKRMTLQLDLDFEESETCTGISINGEKINLPGEVLKANSTNSLVKKSDGEVLMKKISDAMEDRRISAETIAKKSKIARSTFFTYMKTPGRATLATMMRMLHAAGIQKITLSTGGTYREK